jgi:hypothetical protein
VPQAYVQIPLVLAAGIAGLYLIYHKILPLFVQLAFGVFSAACSLVLIPKLFGVGARELMGFSFSTSCISNPIERERIFNEAFLGHLKTLKGENVAGEIGLWVSKTGNMQQNIPKWEIYESPLLNIPLSESQIKTIAQEKADLVLKQWEAWTLTKTVLVPEKYGFWAQCSDYISQGAQFVFEHPWQVAGGWVLIVTVVTVCYLLSQDELALKSIDLATEAMKNQIAEAVRAEVQANPALTLMKHNIAAFQDTAMAKIVYIDEGLDALTTLLIEKKVFLPEEIYEEGVSLFL